MNVFAVDLLAILGGLGTITSSILTLLVCQVSERTFGSDILIPCQIFFPRSFAKENGYKAKTISIKSGAQNTMLYDNHSPTSSTWGVTANQELDQSTFASSPFGRKGQPEAISPPQQRVLLSHTVPVRPLPPGHGGVGSGPVAWDSEEIKYAGDMEAGYHDSDSYIKMESRPYLGDDRVANPAVKLGVPKRPKRPGTSVLNPLVSTSCNSCDSG